MNSTSTTNRYIKLNSIFHKYLIWPLLFFIIFSTGACSFKRLKKDLEKQQNLVTIKGEVVSRTSSLSPIVVALLNNDAIQPRKVNYKVLVKPGTFTFLAKPDTYRIFAYEDSNRDQRHQCREKISCSNVVDATNPGDNITVPTIVIKKNVDPNLLSEVKDLKAKGKIDLVNSKRHTGNIVALDKECFDNKFVTMGLWQTLKFVETVPFGIFFMEKFTTDKIPVLFVHGINGSPCCFKEIIDNLDRNHFQPWLVYYPSGLRLDLIADYLIGQLDELQARCDFTKIQIIAHSMGGLITRRMLNIYSNENHKFKIESLITISTPFAGHQAAAMGLKYAPTVIPVWNDVVPGSTFLNELFQKPLPAELSHYLIFSFEGNSRFADGNNDGVVGIASELRQEAQKESILVRGFAENHTSILKNRDVSNLINRILSHEK